MSCLENGSLLPKPFDNMASEVSKLETSKLRGFPGLTFTTHSWLVFISPNTKISRHGEGIRKLQFMDVSTPNIHEVFVEAPFKHPLLITGKSQCWVRFLFWMNLTDNFNT